MRKISEGLLTVSTMLRFGRLLSLALWIGGIAFFAFVLAPVAFGRLPSAHEAGLVVGGALRVLHVLGLVCGATFLTLTLSGADHARSRRRLLTECLLVGAMAALTAFSQFSVLPTMERYRAEAGGDLDGVSKSDPRKVQFERLHALSERLEGGVLLGGLGLLLVVAGEGSR